MGRTWEMHALARCVQAGALEVWLYPVNLKLAYSDLFSVPITEAHKSVEKKNCSLDTQRPVIINFVVFRIVDLLFT